MAPENNIEGLRKWLDLPEPLTEQERKTVHRWPPRARLCLPLLAGFFHRVPEELFKRWCQEAHRNFNPPSQINRGSPNEPGVVAATLGISKNNVEVARARYGSLLLQLGVFRDIINN